MLQKINSKRGGFTLVEIMIVVAIIALLASIAVPSFMRARVRTQGTQCKQDYRMIDAAVDQWAIETNQAKGAQAQWSDIQKYIKENSALYSSGCKDSLGSTITIPKVGAAVVVSGSTYSALSDVCDAAFWSPYTTTTGT